MRGRISIATHACRDHALGVAPMTAVLRRMAAEHCFTCDALVV
jgi:hypothetical protein